jgi:hypothetical protein
MKIVKENGKIKVQSDYNAEFVKAAKMIQGKWDKPYWVFPEENEPEVRELLMRIYGENGEEQERVDIIVDISEKNGQYIDLCGMHLAGRFLRDNPVWIAPNVVLIAGGFPESGGSRSNPRVNPEEGTKLKVKGVPMGLYERLKDMPNVELCETAEQHKAKLLAEKQRLLERLAAIEAELKN